MRREAQVGIAMRADVVELLQDDGPRLFHRLDHFAEMRDHVIRPVQEVAARQHAGPVHGHRLGHDHRRPAQGAFQQIGAKARAGKALVRHVGGMRPKDDPVAQGVAAQGQRRHQAGVLGHHGSPVVRLGNARTGGMGRGSTACDIPQSLDVAFDMSGKDQRPGRDHAVPRPTPVTIAPRHATQRHDPDPFQRADPAMDRR